MHALLCMLALSGPAAAAEPACRWSVTLPLGCGGTFVVGHADSMMRVVHFTNGEWLAEWIEAGATRRGLALQPSGRTLFSGVAPEVVAQANPFVLFHEGVGLIWGIVVTAFPEVVASVPLEGGTRIAVIDKRELPVTAMRTASGTVRLRIAFGDPSNPQWLDAEIRPAPVEPLADDYPLAGWISSTNARYVTLKDAR